MSYENSKISADALINAELVGAYGHGLSRLKMYCDRISKKVINPKPKIKIKKIKHTKKLKIFHKASFKKTFNSTSKLINGRSSIIIG